MNPLIMFASQLLLILAVAGSLGYLTKDYIHTKEKVDNNFTKAAESIKNEQTDRASSVNNVVDQVNSVNSSFYKDYQTNVSRIDKNHKGLSDGIGAFIQVQESKDGGNALPFIHLPSTPDANVNLMRHVTAVSGLTSKGPVEFNGPAAFSGRATFDSDATFRGPVTLEKGLYSTGRAKFQGPTSFKSGTSSHNSNNHRTRLPGRDGINHIGGDTVVYGNLDTVGYMKTKGGLEASSVMVKPKDDSKETTGIDLTRVDENNRLHSWRQQHMGAKDGQNDFSIWEFAADGTGKVCDGNQDDGARCEPALTIKSKGKILSHRNFHTTHSILSNRTIAAGEGDFAKAFIDADGSVMASKALHVKGGASEHNPDGWWTHFAWPESNKNFIRGDTEIRGNTENVGDLTVGRNLMMKGSVKGSGSMVVETAEGLKIHNENGGNGRLDVMGESWFNGNSTMGRDLSVGGRLCVGTTCVNEETFKKMIPSDASTTAALPAPVLPTAPLSTIETSK